MAAVLSNLGFQDDTDSETQALSVCCTLLGMPSLSGLKTKATGLCLVTLWNLLLCSGDTRTTVSPMGLHKALRLHKGAVTQDTHMDLSGEEFKVIR